MSPLARRLPSLLLSCLLLGLVLAGAPGPLRAREPFYPVSFFQDGAQVLGPHARVEISRLAYRFASQRVRLSTVVVPDTGRQTVEAWTRASFENWGSPEEGMLVVLREHPPALQVEVGTRLGAYLDEDALGRLLDEVAAPRLRRGDRAGALILFLRGLADELLGADPAYEDSGVAYLLPEDRILDPDHLLTPRWREVIDARRRFLERRGVEVGLALIPSSHYYPPKRWSEELFSFWGMRDLKRDNGLMVTLCEDPRSIHVLLGKRSARLFPPESMDDLVRVHARPLLLQGHRGQALAALLRALEELARTGLVPPSPLPPRERWAPGYRAPVPRESQEPREAPEEALRRRLIGRSLLLNGFLPLLALCLTLAGARRGRFRCRCERVPDSTPSLAGWIRLGGILALLFHVLQVGVAGLPLISLRSSWDFWTTPAIAVLVALWWSFELLRTIRSRECPRCRQGLWLRADSHGIREATRDEPGISTAVLACFLCGAGGVWVERFPRRQPWLDTLVRMVALNLGLLGLFLVLLLVPLALLRGASLPPGSGHLVLLLALLAGVMVAACARVYTLFSDVSASPGEARRAAPAGPRLGGRASGGSGAGRSY